MGVEEGQHSIGAARVEVESCATGTLYQVGDLLVDTGRERVIREGVELRIAKLTFDLLVTLMRAAPDVVSFDNLMRSVWPGLVVGLETVSQRVMKLRAA